MVAAPRLHSLSCLAKTLIPVRQSGDEGVVVCTLGLRVPAPKNQDGLVYPISPLTRPFRGLDCGDYRA